MLSTARSPTQSVSMKVCVLGEEDVGKSTLMSQGDNSHASVLCKSVNVVGADGPREVRLAIFCTHGRTSLESPVFRGCEAALLVYDMTSRPSFEALEAHRVRLVEECRHDPMLTVLGNKCDLESQRQVSCAEGLCYAASIKAAFAEVCAADGEVGMNDELERIAAEWVANGRCALAEARSVNLLAPREEKVGDCVCGAPTRYRSEPRTNCAQ